MVISKTVTKPWWKKKIKEQKQIKVNLLKCTVHAKTTGQFGAFYDFCFGREWEGGWSRAVIMGCNL